MLSEVNNAFEELATMPNKISQEINNKSLMLERFVVQIYNRSSDIINVNDARRQLFTKKQHFKNTSILCPTPIRWPRHIEILDQCLIPTIGLIEGMLDAYYQASGSVGIRNWSGISICLGHLIGVGQRNRLDGSFFGPPSLNHRLRVMNESGAAVRNWALQVYESCTQMQ